MTTLFALCISSFIPGAGFYLSRHLSSFPHIFLHSLIPTFHPLTITFAVQRSFSIPGAGFSCPTTRSHYHTSRSHPKRLDYLSTSSIPEAGFSCPTPRPHCHTPRSHPKCLGYLSTSGGIISLEGGSWKVRFSTARPPLRDCRWKTAGRPCCQKLAAWLSWCWTKLWAVTLQFPSTELLTLHNFQN